MKSSKVLVAMAVAAVLAGCSATPEKNTEQAPAETMKTTAQPAVAAPAPASKVEEPKKVAPVVAEPKVEPAPAPAPVMTAAPRMEPKAEPKRELKIPTDPNTFLITASQKTSEHPSHGKGQAMGFDVNGKPGGDVVVYRGETYKFIVDTGVQHDFYLTTSAAGWGAGTYTNGVEGQFIYQGEVTFKPTSKTPDLLYYQCRNHKFMGGKIYVLDKGEDLAKVKAELASKQASGSKTTRRTMAVSESSVKQKLGYAQMVIASGSAKRVEASGNPEAIALLNDARAQIDASKASLAGGALEKAMDQVNEGLRLMTAASRAITSESDMAAVNHKAQYDELKNSLRTYEGSYEKNLERAKKMKQEPAATLDQAAYKKLTDEGDALAAKGDYAAANKSLSKAQQMITSVLTTMLHEQTVTYDKSFETPKEEYEYELARVENYEELIPLAIDQKQPSKQALALIDSFVQKAARIKAEGIDVAAKGDYKMAIMAMQAATSNLQRALRMAGVN